MKVYVALCSQVTTADIGAGCPEHNHPTANRYFFYRGAHTMRPETDNLKLIKSCLMALTAIAVGYTLYFAKPVLVPFVFALFLSYAIAPLSDFLTAKNRLSRTSATLITVCCCLLVVFLLGLLVYASFTELAAHMREYQDKFGRLTATVIAPLEGVVGELDARSIQQNIGSLPLGEILQRTLNNFAALISNTFLIMFFIVYLVFGRTAGAPKSGLFEKIDRRVKKYISLKLVISATTGMLVGLTLWLIGLKLAIVFGILAFLLNLIPSIGSIIATLLPVPMALVQFDSPAPTILVVAVPGALQITVGNLIEPRLLRGALELHPITVLLSLVFWGMVWGFLGLFVAVPITAVIKIVLEQIEYTRPVARLLAGSIS